MKLFAKLFCETKVLSLLPRYGELPMARSQLPTMEVVIVLPADTLNSNGDVGRRHGVVTDADLGANELGLLLLLGGDSFGGVVGGFGGEA
jgi:hypothetical protein